MCSTTIFAKTSFMKRGCFCQVSVVTKYTPACRTRRAVLPTSAPSGAEAPLNRPLFVAAEAATHKYRPHGDSPDKTQSNNVLDIQVHDFQRIFLDELATALNIFTHQC